MHEMNDFSSKEGKNIQSFATSPTAAQDRPVYDSVTDHRQGRWESFRDSFKRDPNAGVMVSKGLDPHGGSYDIEGAAAATANTGLARRLKGRHLQMIAIGGSIGTSPCCKIPWQVD